MDVTIVDFSGGVNPDARLVFASSVDAIAYLKDMEYKKIDIDVYEGTDKRIAVLSDIQIISYI